MKSELPSKKPCLHDGALGYDEGTWDCEDTRPAVSPRTDGQTVYQHRIGHVGSQFGSSWTGLSPHRSGGVNIGRSGLRDMAAEQGNRPVPEKSLHELCHPRGIRRSVSNGLMGLSRSDAQEAFPNRGAVLPVGVWDVHYSGSGHRHSRTVMGHTGCSSHNSPWISGSPLEDLGRLPRSRWNRLVTYIPVKWSHLRNSYSPTGDQAL